MEPTAMDIYTVFGIIGAVYLVIYGIGRAIGVERLRERGLDAGIPFMLMIRTRRLNDFLTRVGKRVPRVFFNVGIVVGFAGMLFGFWMFGTNLLNFFLVPEQAGGVVPIIPGVTITGLPLVYMLIGLAVALLTHEFAHGMASARDGIPIKSAGLLFLFVLFGAFVEPDEEVFEKGPGAVQQASEASPDHHEAAVPDSSAASTDTKRDDQMRASLARARMRVLAAGSFSNMVWAFVFLVLLSNFTGLMAIGFNPPSGAYVYQVADGSPASEVLQVGDVINGLNATDINYWADVSAFMTNAPAGSQLQIRTLRGDFTIILAASKANASRGYIGVYGADYWEPKPGWEWIPGGPLYAFHAQQVLVWGFVILFSIAVFNLLPVPALDGDKLLSNGLSLVIKNERRVRTVMWPLRMLAILIVVLNIGLSLYFGKGIF
jgi:membrane-associated protease RseP (regulator of RpoE activity)